MMNKMDDLYIFLAKTISWSGEHSTWSMTVWQMQCRSMLELERRIVCDTLNYRQRWLKFTIRQKAFMQNIVLHSIGNDKIFSYLHCRMALTFICLLAYLLFTTYVCLCMPENSTKSSINVEHSHFQQTHWWNEYRIIWKNVVKYD